MFRVSRNLSPPIMTDISNKRKKAGITWDKFFKFSRPLVKSVYHESESVSFLGPIIWDMLPSDYNDIDNLNTFKNKIKK